MVLRGTLYSSILQMDTGITVCAPDDYKSTGPLKTAYLLHGLFGNHSNWTDNTMLPVYANDYQVMFIMPDAARSFYIDMAHGQQYFTYVAKELPTLCKGLFNIVHDRKNTAIIGGSMGGYGALRCALTYPEQYGYCLAMASACLYFRETLAEIKKGHPYTGDFKAILGDDLPWNESLELGLLAKKLKDMSLAPQIYCVCGDQDPFVKSNRRFSQDMKSLNYDLEYKELIGCHDWYFFNEALKRALDWWHSQYENQ